MGRKLTQKDDEIIFDLYINQKKSSVEIGKILQTSHRSVLNHLIQITNITKLQRHQNHYGYGGEKDVIN